MNNAANEMIISRGLEKDLPMMEDYVLATHPDIPDNRIPYAEYLLHWEQAKANGGLFKLFNNELIIRRKISYERTAKEVRQSESLSNFHYYSDKVFHDICDIVFDIIDSSIDNRQDRSTLKYHFSVLHSWAYREGGNIDFTMEKYPEFRNFYLITGLLAYRINCFETWFNNAIEYYEDGYFGTATLPHCSKKIVLQRGIKPVRAVTRFVEFITAYCNENKDLSQNDYDYLQSALTDLTADLESLRQEASMLTNQRKFTGNLCISIHPMDFMTMSEPANGWTSCMRWEADDPGEYHSGTLEMMTSPCVIVAYLESKDCIHPAGIEQTWNKKKWRELFVVDRKFISGVKGYPYNNETLETLVFEMLSDLAIKNWGVSFNLDNIEYAQSEEFHGMYLDTNYMYNDWECQTCRAVLADGVKDEDLPKNYYYGEHCYCLTCGKEREYYRNSDYENVNSLWCRPCMNINMEVCPICGRTYEKSEMIEAPDGKIVCENCLDDYRTCAICKESYHESEMTTFAIPYNIPYKFSAEQTMKIGYNWYFYICNKHLDEAQKIKEMMHCEKSCSTYYVIKQLNEQGLAWLKKYVPAFFWRRESNSTLRVEWTGSEEPSVKIDKD